MKDLVNKFYKNHALVYKVLLFIVTTFLIVYLFPKSGKFKYDFEKGKPWQSETLYAPFDFAIQKTSEELALEKEEIEKTATKYFSIDTTIKSNVLKAYNENFNNSFPDSMYTSKDEIKKFGLTLLQKLYEYGITNEDELNENKSVVVILKDRVEVSKTDFSNIYKQSQVKPNIDEELKKQNLEQYAKPLSILFFNIVEPNLEFNKTLSDRALEERLNSISYNRGSIEKETLIISKGEVVEGNKFLILKSLESEYESQVWNESNYNLIIFAYTLLVALALLMLLLFLRKYRLDVFNNNTKVTFIFFNVFLMVLLTTLIVNYNSKYIYIVPIAILPLVLKAFFDARLGLFSHVITVLLLGFIVPNSYEYMFLQIRSKSVGETATLSVICPDDGKTRVNVKINYSEVGVQMSVDHTNEIQLTDDIKMFMRYPTLNSFDSFDEKDETESTLKMMQSCVDEIHFGDDVYRRVDMSDKELSEFFNDMTTDMFSRVQEFFSTMPKLRHILDIKNPKTKKKSEYMLEGLADFFI